MDSGEERQVQAAELRVDEARNAQDVRAFLASVALRFVESDVTMTEIEASVKNKFGIIESDY